MRINRIVNSFLQSNTFVLSTMGENDVYVVDIGDVEPLMKLIGNRCVKGVFLTHAHYDHIYGINNLLEEFPECIIYGSQPTLNALKNDKLNFSYYYDTPLNYIGGNEVVIENNNVSIALWGVTNIKTIITPGHTLGSTCFIVDNNIFTGDAYIPNIPPVTKLKEGNKIQAAKSVKLIQNLIKEGDILHPGHLAQYEMKAGILQPLCKS